LLANPAFAATPIYPDDLTRCEHCRIVSKRLAEIKTAPAAVGSAVPLQKRPRLDLSVGAAAALSTVTDCVSVERASERRGRAPGSAREQR